MNDGDRGRARSLQLLYPEDLQKVPDDYDCVLVVTEYATTI